MTQTKTYKENPTVRELVAHLDAGGAVEEFGDYEYGWGWHPSTTSRQFWMSGPIDHQVEQHRLVIIDDAPVDELASAADTGAEKVKMYAERPTVNEIIAHYNAGGRVEKYSGDWYEASWTDAEPQEYWEKAVNKHLQVPGVRLVLVEKTRRIDISIYKYDWDVVLAHSHQTYDGSDTPSPLYVDPTDVPGEWVVSGPDVDVSVRLPAKAHDFVDVPEAWLVATEDGTVVERGFSTYVSAAYAVRYIYSNAGHVVLPDNKEQRNDN